MIQFAERIVWLPIRNGTNETIPGGALVERYRPTGDGETGQDDDGNFWVRKPTSDSDPAVLVNGEAEIPPGETGLGHRDTMAVLLYDTTETLPLTGDNYGSKAGSWQAHFGKRGFIIDAAGNGRAIAYRDWRGLTGTDDEQSGSGSGEEGSGSGGDGSDNRCTGTVYSITRYRNECIEGILYQYTWLETLVWNDVGCLDLIVGEETAEEIGCCECINSGCCDGGGGGIGGDPETVVTECCNGRPLPKSIPIRVESTCAVFNGLTGFAVWDGEKWVKQWTIDCDANCTTLTAYLECIGGTLSPSIVVGPVPPCTFTTTENPPASIDCGPPLLVSGTTGTIAAGTCCEGETFTIIWEESDTGGDGIDGGGP